MTTATSPTPSAPTSTAADPGATALGRGDLAYAGRVGVMVAVLVAAVAGGFLVTGEAATARAVAEAGDDLTRLLRAMAALKSLLALGASAALLWRLGAPVSRTRFAIYALAGAAMAAGPGVIWGMAYVRTGAALLHLGLASVVVMLWRDPAVAERLASLARLASARRSRPSVGPHPPGVTPGNQG